MVHAGRGDERGLRPCSPRMKRRMDAALDRRHGDRPLAEMLEKKFPDHSATLPTGVLRQTPDVAHVGIEARQLLFDDGIADRILQRHAAGFEYLQKMAQRRLQLMAKPTDRIGAGTRRQVFREKAHNGALADRFQVIPLLCSANGRSARRSADRRVECSAHIALAATVPRSAKRRAEEYCPPSQARGCGRMMITFCMLISYRVDWARKETSGLCVPHCSNAGHHLSDLPQKID